MSGPPTAGSESLTRRVAAALDACESAKERAHAALLLLCDGRNRRSGMLFLLMPSGLTLAASTHYAVAQPEVESFAILED